MEQTCRELQDLQYVTSLEPVRDLIHGDQVRSLSEGHWLSGFQGT